MLLRSSSAPVAQTLFSDCSNRDLDTSISNNNRLTNTHEHCARKISFCHSVQQHLSSFSCSSSPTYPSQSVLPEFSPKGISIGRKTFRRAQSDSHLEGLVFPASFDLEKFHSSRRLMSGSLHYNQESMLHTEPSFSIYSTDDKFDEGTANEDLIKEKMMENEEKLERSATIGENIEAQFSFGENAMRMIKEDDNEDEEVDQEEEKERSSNEFKDLNIGTQGVSVSPLIGAGGINANEIGEGVGFGLPKSDHNGDLDTYYNKMVCEDPSNPLVLRNYAQFLESKRDFSGAEEYYYRATLADPRDGEILSQYAKLVWEIHGDQARASTYFERAARAAPRDSHVLAAYASFLWKIDDNDEEDRLSNTQADENAVQVDLPATDFKTSSPPLHLAMGLGIDMASFAGGNDAVDYISTNSNESATVEECYRRKIEENPSNPLFMRNYAHFLHQTKGDLHGAEEYYSRAILVDPGDGQILSLYANILWELHRDKDRAVAYFERAVQATPEDSNVLGAYAKFLWETEEEEEDATEEGRHLMPVAQGAGA